MKKLKQIVSSGLITSLLFSLPLLAKANTLYGLVVTLNPENDLRVKKAA